VITPLFDKAREEARSPRLAQGPFRGVPYLLKDLDVHSAGDPFHCGMRFLRDLRWVQQGESYLVAKLRRAGFIFLGKTNTPELGLNVTTEPASYGPCRNPWNTEHSSGGSSGGSAAAVAARMVPAAHASDGGGSIRIPASTCGLIGYKPPYGRNPDDPPFNLDFYCKAFGIESPKSHGVSGLDVNRLLAEGRSREIAEYCLRDVRATLELYQIWRSRLAGIK
jgi:amidase